MERPPPKTLALRAVRRALGIAVFLELFYLAAPSVWDIPPLAGRDVVLILVVSFLGVALGVAFSFFAPLPAEKGLPRVIRTVLLTIPALGIGIAIQLAVEGPQGARAFHVMFALAAWLGSGFVREGEDEDEADDTDDPTGTGASDGIAE